LEGVVNRPSESALRWEKRSGDSGGTRVHIAVSAAKKKSLMRQPERKSKGSLQLEKQQNPKSETEPMPAKKVRGWRKFCSGTGKIIQRRHKRRHRWRSAHCLQTGATVPPTGEGLASETTGSAVCSLIERCSYKEGS
jgi:hypothetical protein